MAGNIKTPSKRSGLAGPPEIGFQRGLNSFQANRLLLETGECATLVNADLANVGYLGILKGNTTYKTGLTGRVHSLYKTGDNLFVGHGTTMSHVDVSTGAVTVIPITLNGKDLRMFSFENFLYVSDGENPQKIYIPGLEATVWGIDNPLTAPSAAVGASGNPSGTYDLYYTYVAKYDDGTEYETDLSPVGQIAVSGAKIEWTYPATAPDSQITHIRLYRDKTGITATLDDVREAVEARQLVLENQTGKKMFSGLLQQIIRRQTNRRVVENMQADQGTFVGPFYVDEVELGTVGYSDNISDDNIVLNLPFARERYLPIFGA